jgi:hypothetical protein
MNTDQLAKPAIVDLSDFDAEIIARIFVKEYW